ncbi:DUF5643 domain-containing protein [Paenibacillus odorifer]|uniref:DUF5643 domain-containing protein n=1 Tax=Paenibacillus TaxID=44249 RepID=UPI00096F4912|nr:DUF5643 domain-containing protein [Paenibacillus odorifer]OMC98795.1 hypothetical protein BJP46_03485 [Paenibacillus odorifer]
MKKMTKKMSVILSAAVCLGALGMPALTQASSAQPAVEASLNTTKVADSHDQLTLKGSAQFDGNYIKIDLSRQGSLFSGMLAGVTLNDKGEPYLAEGTIVGIDAKLAQPGGIDLKTPRWISDGDANKAVVVLQTGWLTEQQKASLASSELSIYVKLNGIENPYVLKFSLKQAGLVRNIQLPAIKNDNQFEIKTTRVAAGETSVRIALAVKGVATQGQALGYDIYDNLGNKLESIARDSVAATQNTVSEDLLFEAPRSAAEYLVIRPYQAVFEKGNTGAYKLDAKGNVVKNYNKQLEIKIPLK